MKVMEQLQLMRGGGAFIQLPNSVELELSSSDAGWRAKSRPTYSTQPCQHAIYIVHKVVPSMSKCTTELRGSMSRQQKHTIE